MLIALLLAGCSTGGTVAPPGDATHFDPVANLAEVSRFAGDGFQLTGMTAMGVRADGTIDLNQPAGQAGVTYDGFHEVPAPKDAPPVGAGGSLDGRYWETVTVRLFEPGQFRQVSSGGSKWTYTHKGMAREGSTQPTRPTTAPLPPPACRPADLFRALTEQGAPANAVAMLSYDADGWRIEVRDTAYLARFDAACARVK